MCFFSFHLSPGSVYISEREEVGLHLFDADSRVPRRVWKRNRNAVGEVNGFLTSIFDAECGYGFYIYFSTMMEVVETERISLQGVIREK